MNLEEIIKRNKQGCGSHQQKEDIAFLISRLTELEKLNQSLQSKIKEVLSAWRGLEVAPKKDNSGWLQIVDAHIRMNGAIAAFKEGNS